MILSDPTQGVDVGAKNEFMELLWNLQKPGWESLSLPGEAQEILKICDRVLVMYHGVLKGRTASQRALGRSHYDTLYRRCIRCERGAK